jgi:hypothetical protein
VIILGEGKSLPWVFYTFPEKSCKYSSIFSVFSYFSIKKPAVLWEISDSNLKILNNLINSLFRPVFQANLKEGESFENIKKVVGKTLKSEGLMNYLILNNKIPCSTFENVLKDLHLEKQWSLSLYFDECIYQMTRTGSFVLVHESVLESKSRNDYFINALTVFLETIKESNNKYQIFKKFSTFQPNCSYALANFNESIQHVATINNGTFQQLRTFRYFTEETRVILNKPLIEFSANTGSQNPPGYKESFQNSKFQTGTIFSVSYINSLLTLLPHHDLSLFKDVNCGVNIFNESFSRSCFVSLSSKLGVAYIPTLYSITIPVLNQFKTLGLSTPFISGFGSTAALSNSSLFPNFKRMCSSIEFISHVYTRIFYIMGWQNIVLFYSNEPFGEMISSVLVEEQKNSRYQIVNDEKYRKIDYLINSSNSQNYRENIENAVKTNCNIFVLAMSDPSPFLFLEAVYDYGIRRGDIQVVLFTLTGPSVASGSAEKRAELLHGSFSISNAAWVGDYGEEVRSKYLKSPSSIDAPVPSFYIDAVLSIAYTSQLMIFQGQSPEDPKLFMQQLSSIRFLGTSGTVNFDSGSNNRNLIYFFIYNYFQDKTQWKTEPVGVVDPLSSVYFKVLKTPVWASGSFPDDMKVMYLDCGFPEGQVKFSTRSFTLQVTVLVLVFIVVVCLVLYDVSKLPRKPFEMLDSKKVPQLEDLIMFWFVFIESFQVLSIGPTTGQFSSFLSNLSDLLSLKFTKSSHFRNERYWMAFYLLIFSGYFWVLLFFLSHLKICRFLHRKVKNFLEFVTPIIANYLFIPVISGLFSILSCEQSTDDSFKSSFFYFDCSLHCWRGNHLHRVVQAFVLLTFFIPISIYYRTRWQEHKSGINFKASSFYLIMKNILLMTLLIFEKVVKTRNETVHSILFLFIIFIITLQICCRSAFNYDRANLWVKVMMVCVLWNTGTVVVFEFVSFNRFIFLGLQLAGWVVALNFGIYFHSKLPEDYLEIGEDASIGDLFKFAISRKSLSPIIVQSEGNSLEIETHRAHQNII